LGNAAQGFAVRHTQRTSQPESRGERHSAEKGPFLDGHQLKNWINFGGQVILNRQKFDIIRQQFFIFFS